MMLFRPALLLVLSLAMGVFAAEDSSQDQGKSTPVPATLASPRATMDTFLRAMSDVKGGQQAEMETALQTLDLSGVNPLVRTEKGAELAWTLSEILDRLGPVDSRRLPDRSRGSRYLHFKDADGRVVSIDPQADGRWLFSQTSINQLPAILDGLREQTPGLKDEGPSAYKPLGLRLRDALPNGLKHTSFLLEDWQWTGIVAVVLLGILLDKLAAFVLARVVHRLREGPLGIYYQEVAAEVLRPFALLVMAGVWWAGLNLLSLPADALAILLLAAKFLAALAGVWGTYRLVDLLSGYLRQKAAKTATRVDDVLVPLFTKTAKVLVTVVGAIFLADTLKMNVTGLLAGLGLGGLAFALAAKDVVENLFGSVTVLTDRPFHVGDWVRIGEIEGTVESMGFRSTRIRTFYNSQVTIPNSRLITAHVDNMGERRYRRYKATLRITLDTPPEKVDAFCEGIRELVRQHPNTRKDYYQVFLNDFGSASLDVLVYIFFRTPDWGAELRARHDFLLDVLRLARQQGVRFAYPTQTLYLQNLESDSAM
ncbi:MAG: mechanosensitive ion channel family protein [Chromatiales bacterium]|nr:mechanosensitive ion channel family protein [Chromatiales bacterium]